jgi:hypothetical protein
LGDSDPELIDGVAVVWLVINRAAAKPKKGLVSSEPTDEEALARLFK